MLHNLEAYPDLGNFHPERFLASDSSLIEDPLLISAYGWGRRCACISPSLPRLTFQIDLDCCPQNLSRKVSRECNNMVDCRLDLVCFQCWKGERC